MPEIPPKDESYSLWIWPVSGLDIRNGRITCKQGAAWLGVGEQPDTDLVEAMQEMFAQTPACAILAPEMQLMRPSCARRPAVNS